MITGSNYLRSVQKAQEEYNKLFTHYKSAVFMLFVSALLNVALLLVLWLV